MSGYLQRLARSVMQPSERVHPMVGSVFSIPANQVEAEAGTPSLELGERSQEREPRERAQEQNVEISRPAPLIPHSELLRPVQRVQAPNEATSNPSRPVKAHEHSSEAPEREPVGAASLARKEEGSQQNVYAPLMPVSEVRSEPKIIPQIAPNPAASSRRDTGKVEAVRGGKREADDIQIHIGRIEVLAIPPAPPVARPAKSPHKASSLDDYLKRRDQRTL
jgi:hypothetical protein